MNEPSHPDQSLSKRARRALIMQSKLRVLVATLGLLLVAALSVSYLLMTRMLAGAGAAMAEGGLRGVHGRLAFVSRLPATHGINLVSADGTDRAHLPVASDALIWSPDGTRFVSENCCGDLLSSLIVINVDGSGLMRLTDNGGAPVWSPDGTRLAFVINGADHRTSIEVITADASDLRKLTNDGSAPAWSPDGTRLAFATYRDNQAQAISIVKTDGSGLIQLTSGIAGGPLWHQMGTV